MLPARYHNHQACFTIVWIISNEPLDQQYPETQGERRQILTRRINENLQMLPGCVIVGKSHNESRENACAAQGQIKI